MWAGSSSSFSSKCWEHYETLAIRALNDLIQLQWGCCSDRFIFPCHLLLIFSRHSSCLPLGHFTHQPPTSREEYWPQIDLSYRLLYPFSPSPISHGSCHQIPREWMTSTVSVAAFVLLLSACTALTLTHITMSVHSIKVFPCVLSFVKHQITTTGEKQETECVICEFGLLHCERRQNMRVNLLLIISHGCNHHHHQQHINWACFLQMWIWNLTN